MTGKRVTAPYMLKTERLVLRCWQPSDAAALTQAIAESLPELRQWLPWAQKEPESVAAKAVRLRGFREQFALGKDFLFGMFDAHEMNVLGAVGMHDRIGAGAREIGYWIRTSHARQGLATESVAALCRIGFDLLDLRWLEIHCDPQNAASAAIPRKLGFRHHVTIRNCVLSPKIGPRNSQIWVLKRDTYEAGEAIKTPVRAFDDSGAPLQLS